MMNAILIQMFDVDLWLTKIKQVVNSWALNHLLRLSLLDISSSLVSDILATQYERAK